MTTMPPKITVSVSPLTAVTGAVTTALEDTSIGTDEVLAAVRAGFSGKSENVHPSAAPISEAVGQATSEGLSREDVLASVRSGMEALISRIPQKTSGPTQGGGWGNRIEPRDQNRAGVAMGGWGGNGRHIDQSAQAGERNGRTINGRG